MTRLLSLAVAALLPALTATRNAHAETPAVRRFALVVGSNDGGSDRVGLRYAGGDARAVAGVLKDLGGVALADLVLLVEPNADGVREGFKAMRKLLDKGEASARLELVFYYSGHSDEEGILPSGGRISYSELREILSGMPAGVRIAIVDSCASGALTRGKGGKRLAPFLSDKSVEVSGHAFLTSTSADEVAQESDKIEASFFTHYLVSGLRGAADVNRDARVTLTEAYQFAFAETLARTQKTKGGAQHPNYDIQLAGTGDLVITDLRSTTSGIVIEPGVEGRVFVHDEDGRLAAELRKPADSAIELGLPPGRYRLVVETEGASLEATIVVDAGGDTHIDKGDLRKSNREATTARGDAGGEWDRVVPLSFTILPGLATSGAEDNTMHVVNIGLLVGRAAWLRGVALAGVASWVDHDVRGLQIAGAANWAGRDLRGFQIAGGANVVGRNVRGFQIAGGANVTGRDVHGLQIAGGGNVAGRIDGFQIAGGLNYAERVDGSQIAVVNIGGDVKGSQIGVINVARRVRGVQVGVLNISDEMGGLPLGILNFARKGRIDLDLWLTESGTHAGVKLGSRWAYSLMGVGADGDLTNVGEEGRSAFTTTLGFGVHIPYGAGAIEFVDVDASMTSSPWEEDFVLSTLRGVLAFPVGEVHLLLGVSFNVGVGWNGFEQETRVDTFNRIYTSADGETTVQLYPGVIVGLEI